MVCWTSESPPSSLLVLSALVSLLIANSKKQFTFCDSFAVILTLRTFEIVQRALVCIGSLTGTKSVACWVIFDFFLQIWATFAVEGPFYDLQTPSWALKSLARNS